MATKTKYAVEMVAIDKIVPYEHNPRRIDQTAVDAVASSISDFGWQQNLVVWPNQSGQLELVVGHTRLLAAKQLGLKEVPCRIANELTEDQVRLYRIVDNKSGEHSEWNMELLKLEIEKLETMDWPSLKMNFTQLEFDTIQGAHWHSDIERVDKISESDATARSLISIECEQAERDDLLKIIQDALAEKPFTNVRIRE